MTHYSVQPIDETFVKGYWLSFAKNMGWNIGKNIRNILSSKYSQKLIDHAKKSSTHSLKTASKRAIEKKKKKKIEPTSDLMRNKITDRITKVSKTSPQNNSEENIEHDREIHRERYIFPEQRQKIIDDLRLMW